LDTLTHALSGALLGRATAGRHSPLPLGQRMTVGALAAAFPDADYVVSFVSPLSYLLNHRGLTHSLLVLPLWAWLLAWLAAIAFRDPRGWRAYLPIAALGVASHILGDLITSYGTMVLAPVSDRRFAWGTTFIIDLWFSGIIIAGLLASSVWKPSRLPAFAATGALVAYVGFQGWLKSEALAVGERQAREAHIEGARVTAQPGPVSPFNWTVVIDREGKYRYATVNLARRDRLPRPDEDSGFFYRLSAPFDPPLQASWSQASLDGGNPVAREAWNSEALAFFRWFAEYPTLLRIDSGNPSTCAWFYDLRFVRPGGGTLPFRYGACREADGPWRRFQLVGDDERRALD
jgi:inner membrane protein